MYEHLVKNYFENGLYLAFQLPFVVFCAVVTHMTFSELSDICCVSWPKEAGKWGPYPGATRELQNVPEEGSDLPLGDWRLL